MLCERPVAISEKYRNTSNGIVIVLVVAGWGRRLVDDSQIGNAIVIEVRSDNADW
jgi:hypothetical protein